MMNKTRRKKLDTVLTYVILILLAAFIVIPVLWMLSTAFKTEAQTYYPNPKWIPDPFSLESFHKFFSTYNFGKMTVNSLITCLAAMVICVACACLAGYGITRFKFKGRKQLLNFLLITQMFPKCYAGSTFLCSTFQVSSDQHIIRLDRRIRSHQCSIQHMDAGIVFQDSAHRA